MRRLSEQYHHIDTDALKTWLEGHREQFQSSDNQFDYYRRNGSSGRITPEALDQAENKHQHKQDRQINETIKSAVRHNDIENEIPSRIEKYRRATSWLKTTQRISQIIIYANTAQEHGSALWDLLLERSTTLSRIPTEWQGESHFTPQENWSYPYLDEILSNNLV